MPQFRATDVVITDDLTDAVSAIREATDGRGVDYVFDAVGLARSSRFSSIVCACGHCRAGRHPLDWNRLRGGRGRVHPAGEGADRVDFGSADTTRDFVDYAQRYLDGRLPIDRLVTERYRLVEIIEACDAMLTGCVGRGVIVFD